MAHGVTHVQICVNLRFDDGREITLSTPVWHKDIRQGDLFPKDMLQQIMREGGDGFAEMLDTCSLDQIYAHVVAKEKTNEPPQTRKPGWLYGDDGHQKPPSVN